MTLTTPTDLYYDEQLTNLGIDSADSDKSLANYTASPISTVISGLTLNYYSSPTGFPQFAEEAGFISDNNAVTSYSLVRDNSGTAFSTTIGVATSLQVNVGGTLETVYLFATSNPDVVVGRVGTSATDNTAPVALVIGLDGSNLASPNIWVSAYAPFVHSGANLIDDSDTLNLANLISVRADFSTVNENAFNNFTGISPGQDQFAMVSPAGASVSGNVDLLFTGFTFTGSGTLGTVNVSTTGLGANSQAIDPTEALRVDVVSANAADFAKEAGTGVHYASNISYQNHLGADWISFQVTQVNPTGKNETITVKLYNDSTNAQGADLVNNALTNEGSLVSILSYKILDSSGADITTSFLASVGTANLSGGVLTVTNLPVMDQIKVYTDSAHTFDRMLVENTGGAHAPSFDIGNVHVQTVTGGSGTDYTELGSHLVFEDGGPSFGANGSTVPTVQIDETTLGAAGNTTVDFHSLFDPHYGPDGAAASSSLTYALGIGSTTGVDSGLQDTASGHEIYLFTQGGDVVGRVGSASAADSGGQIDFRISVASDGNVTFEQDYAVMHAGPTVTDESVGMSAGTVAGTAALVTLTATATDGDGDSANSQALGIGGAFSILDDEPSMSGHVLATDDFVTVANTIGSENTNLFTLHSNNDGLSTATGLGYTIVGPADTSGAYRWSYTDSTHTSIIETYNGVNLFSLALDSATGNYTMHMLGSLPLTPLNLDASNIKAGGPTGSIDVGTLGSSGDYVEISGTYNNTSGQLNGIAGNVNASNGNVGVSNGNLDGGEALSFSLFSSTGTLIPFYGFDMGTKTAQSSSYHLYGVLASNHTTVVDLGIDGSPLAKGGTISYAGNVLLDSIIVEESAGNAVKIGLSGIHLLLPPSDAGFHFTAQLTDGDGDHVSMPFNAYIDGDGGGVDHSTVAFV